MDLSRTRPVRTARRIHRLACGGSALLLFLIVGLSGKVWLRRTVSNPASLPGVEVHRVSLLGPGISIGVFGGLRQVIGNYFWLRGYLHWESRDPAQAEAAFAMAVAVDPQEWFFWTNGIRMIAFDFPRWELQALREWDDSGLDECAEQMIRRRYAARALDWLSAAERVFPQDPRVGIERGMIQLHAMGDRRAAALAFRAAWEKPGAPLFIARIYAELMRAEGEERLAYDWYREWLPSLPPDVRAAQTEIVLPRIAELEESLEIPPSERFVMPVKRVH